MQRSIYRQFIPVLALGLSVLILTGCSDQIASLDARDQGQPLMQRAAAKAQEGDYESAVRLYTRALELDPSAARGHLDVALILDTQLKDHVRAIYHYQRYIESRPKSEKSDMILDRIRRAQQLYAASIIPPGHYGVRVLVLEQENAQLKTDIAKLTSDMDGLRRAAARRAAAVGTGAAEAGGPGAGAVPRSREPQTQARLQAGVQPPPPRATQIYVVQVGDSLSRIAAQVYGDRMRWKEIQTANRDILGNSEQVRIGQRLKIP